MRTIIIIAIFFLTLYPCIGQEYDHGYIQEEKIKLPLEEPFQLDVYRFDYKDMEWSTLEDTVTKLVHTYLPNSDFYKPSNTFTSRAICDLYDNILFLFEYSPAGIEYKRVYDCNCRWFVCSNGLEYLYLIKDRLLYKTNSGANEKMYDSFLKRYAKRAESKKRDKFSFRCIGIRAAKRGNYITSIDMFVFY